MPEFSDVRSSLRKLSAWPAPLAGLAGLCTAEMHRISMSFEIFLALSLHCTNEETEEGIVRSGDLFKGTQQVTDGDGTRTQDPQAPGLNASRGVARTHFL